MVKMDDTLGLCLMEQNVPVAERSILLQVATAAKMLSRQVHRASLAGIVGAEGRTNVHGEAVQKLDMLAHDLFIAALLPVGCLAGIVSEEMEGILQTPSPHPGYLFLMDPLDGSSNIDVSVGIGSIFSVHRKTDPGQEATLADFLQPGRRQILAGYCLYGSSTVLVYTTGNGTHGFTLDPDMGEFRLSHNTIQVPKTGPYYSINEGNTAGWEMATQRYVSAMKTEGRSARYIGSLVADFHRNLLKGGVFLYPSDQKNKQGKLRLLYEAAPLAFVVEQAGGMASTGRMAILDVPPESLHQRTPLIIGSADDVARAEALWG